MNRHHFIKKRINGSFANNPSQPLIFFTITGTTLKSRHHTSTKRTLPIHTSNSSLPFTATIITTTATRSASFITTHHSSLNVSSPISTPSIPQQQTQNNKSNELSSGTIVGITFSAVCAIALVIFIYFFFIIRKERKLTSHQQNAASKQQSYLDVVMTQSDVPSSTSYNHTILHNEKIFIRNNNTSTREIYTVASAFTQTLDDELYIQPGDKVQIFNAYDDGWCLGKNLTRGGATGVLPQNCLDKHEIMTQLKKE